MTANKEQQKPLHQIIAEVIADYINKNLPYFQQEIKCPNCGMIYNASGHRCKQEI
jgi:hypothetical protein